jgi:uroporphyrinogen decarboxylase
VGLEAFCYYLADCPEIIDAQLERQAERAVQWIEHLPDDHGIAAVFSGDDIAFTNGPLLRPEWFESSYWPRLKRVVEAYHGRGIAVNFHSDGDLNLILDSLVDTGIDMLNPIEVLAGMDIGDVRRRYPNLILAGGIDVSQLLPFGTPDRVRDATVKAIEDAEGKIMIGSSTELQNTVPLENFLAMREAAINYRLR